MITKTIILENSIEINKSKKDLRLHMKRVVHLPENIDHKWPIRTHILEKLLDLNLKIKTKSLCFEVK